MRTSSALLAVFAFAGATGKLVNFESAGAIPNDDSWDTVIKNGQLLNSTLNSLAEGDVFLVPNVRSQAEHEHHVDYCE